MKKVLVGLSGGVDSAVAAYLLKEQGYDVTCAFMRNWDSAVNDDVLGNPTLDDPVCTQEKDYADAEAVAAALGLDLLRVDFIQEYWDEVFRVFLSEYKKGRTPNPDILCNKHIKFDHFRRYAEKMGFDTLATGHYAGIGLINEQHVLTRASDLNKDQSYFLCQISRDTLDHVLFPLQSLKKTEVRRLARERSIPVAEKKDSTGICFIGERDFRQFLTNYLPMKDGKIRLLTNKETVGTHHGVYYYTVGQRKGLDIGGTGPYFVAGKSIARNELYVTDSSHLEWLVSDSCEVGSVNWLADVELPLECTAKFRYRQADIQVRLEENEDGRLLVSYPQTAMSVTPGQEAVFYTGNTVIAGGTIENVFREHRDLMDLIEGLMSGND